jgi:hypothetical protein
MAGHRHDDDHLGQPSTGTTPENVAKVRDLILQDRRLTIRDLCNTLGTGHEEDCGEVCATTAAK